MAARSCEGSPASRGMKGGSKDDGAIRVGDCFAPTSALPPFLTGCLRAILRSGLDHSPRLLQLRRDPKAGQRIVERDTARGDTATARHRARSNGLIRFSPLEAW